jgi:hypothetical protein
MMIEATHSERDGESRSGDIIAQALRLERCVARFRTHAKAFFQAVVLCAHLCPVCAASLFMVAAGKCQCHACGKNFDPTIAFQRCGICGGAPIVNGRHYACASCAATITSRFLFDESPFDAEYFRQKMAESRERKAQQDSRAHRGGVPNRSPAINLPVADGDSLSSLLASLSTMSINDPPHQIPITPQQAFDLRRYERHVEAHLATIPVALGDLPGLIEDVRLDKIWRFVAIIFLVHERRASAWQEGPTIWVTKGEAIAEG